MGFLAQDDNYSQSREACPNQHAVVSRAMVELPPHIPLMGYFRVGGS